MGDENSTFYAGVDWGEEHHQLCVVDDRGQRRAQEQVSRDVTGLARLRSQLLRFGPGLPVAIERSEGLLVEHLQAHGHPVYPVSPRIAARARERYKVASVKDDRFDAYVLADTLRFEHQGWRPLSVPSPVLAEIKALTRDRDRLLETQQAIESQLRMILESYHPAPARLFSSVDRQITLSFVLDYPTPATASRVKATRMSGFLTRHHYTGRTSGQVLAERMRANLLTGSAGTVAGKSFSAQSYARLLGLLNSQLAEYDDAIASAVSEHPDAPIFASFPGVGPVLTGILLAEIGEDRGRYPDPAVLLAEAGLAPVTRASGRSHIVRFRYAANAHLRDACMWWAFNSMKTSRGRPPRSNRRARIANSTTTERFAAWPPDGPASCGAAGRTAPPTTPTGTPVPRP